MNKILVIDDEHAIRSDIVQILEFEGFQVMDAPNGIIGIQRAKTFLPDVIICDIMMPELDGYDVLQELRDFPPTAAVPFLFLTALNDRQSQRQGMSLGADDFITKPFQSEELLAAIFARLKQQKRMQAMTEQNMKQVNENVFKMVSDRLRQPMDSMNMVMDVIRLQMDSLPPEDLRDLLETVDYGNRRLTRLVDEIVLNVQLDSGLLTPDKIVADGDIFPLREVWMLAIGEARKYATERPDVEIYTDEIDEGLLICGQRMALQFALSQMIGHALTYAPDNGEVTITQWQCETDGCVRILHKGQVDFAEVFESNQQGTTLGLTLVKRIIEAHNGHFYTRAEVDKDTQITVRLPLVEGN